MRREDFDQFCKVFEPVQRADEGMLWETYGEDVEYIWEQDVNHVWTIVDCDGKLYISPGRHLVNRMNYVLTKNKWDDKTRDYKY